MLSGSSFDLCLMPAAILSGLVCQRECCGHSRNVHVTEVGISIFFFLLNINYT